MTDTVRVCMSQANFVFLRNRKPLWVHNWRVPSGDEFRSLVLTILAQSLATPFIEILNLLRKMLHMGTKIIYESF